MSRQPAVYDWNPSANRYVTIDPLTRAEEARLVPLAQAGDQDALDTLVRANTRFVKDVAQGYIGGGVDLDDLIAEGCVGLLEGIRRFDPSRGYKLISYAVHWIRQAMQAAVVTQPRVIRIPSSQIANVAKVGRHQNRLSQRLGRRTSRAEAVLDLRDQGEHVAIAGQDGQLPIISVMSFDAQLADQHGEPISPQFADPEAEERLTEDLFRRELAANIDRSMASLTDRERSVVRRYFGMEGPPYTLEEIGHQLGITRERVRQLKEKALSKMRRTAAVLEHDHS